jgi:hypothetical protein
MTQKMKTGFLGVAAVVAVAAFLHSCNYPYEPDVQQQPVSGGAHDSTSHIYATNGNEQICNPSVSPNQAFFPASMLWLNLGGNLNVTIPQGWAAQYSQVAGSAHDRLTVTDTSNTVRWFLMKPAFVLGEIQDPEWSTHPNFVAFSGEIGGGKWDGCIAKLSDKSILQFNKEKLCASSTPHVWVPDDSSAIPEPDTNATASVFSPSGISWGADGMVDSATVRAYFGTRDVKFVFCNQVGAALTIYYADYADSNGAAIALPKPSGREDWLCESPLISPDGKWIVFNCKNTPQCESYLQKLEPGATPILISAKAAEPHWYVNDSTWYVLYSSVLGPISNDLANAPEDGTIGTTYVQKVNLSQATAGVPSWLVFDGDPKPLVKLPFQGGLTRDGRCLATGYQYGYFYVFSGL